MFGHLGAYGPPAVLANVSNSLTRRFDPSLPESLTFAKPFPVPSQQWSAFQPIGRIISTYPQGWHPFDEYRFIPRFPVNVLPFATQAGNPSIPSWF